VRKEIELMRAKAARFTEIEPESPQLVPEFLRTLIWVRNTVGEAILWVMDEELEGTDEEILERIKKAQVAMAKQQGFIAAIMETLETGKEAQHLRPQQRSQQQKAPPQVPQHQKVPLQVPQHQKAQQLRPQQRPQQQKAPPQVPQ